LNVMPRIKLTKTNVSAIEHPEAGQVLMFDTTLSGFGLRVGRKTKTYFAEKRVAGRTTRVTIGQHGNLTCEQARRDAQRQLGAMAGGKNPNREKRLARASGVTVKEAIATYHQLRKLRPHTAYDYKRLAAVAFPDWLELPLRSISKDRVLERHTHLAKDHGPAYANQAMRLLRAVYNLQVARDDGRDGQTALPPNPVMVLSKARAWFKIQRRQTLIKPADLGAWLAAVSRLCPENAPGIDSTVRDYLRLLVLTGLRRTEGAALRWSDIDWKSRTLTITKTKNGDPHTLPLPNYLFGLLQKRRLATSGKYVFPGNGRTGHLVEPRSQMTSVSASCGVNFCLHDLRRTFISVADSLDISRFAIQRLLNHRAANDVTAGYIVPDVERLRKAMQQIEDACLAKLSDHERQTRDKAANA